jgi:hypothetical protein
MDDLPQPRKYFSERHGRGPKAQPLPFDTVRRLVINVFDDLRQRGYMQEAFGIECVDGDSDGTLGYNPDAYFMRTIMREGIWPYWYYSSDPQPYERWDADTLFDVVEVMHDLVSRPKDGSFHDYNECGMHYSTFDRSSGQADYRKALNQVLRLNDPPYELDGLGQIVESAPEEFHQLLSAPVPPGTEHGLITAKIDAAVTRFRSRGASIEDRRHAVRDLADVLEALRGDIKESMLTADEKALFQIANGFSIRHNNRDQKGDYDRVTWLRWSFYIYLATIHAVLRVRKLQSKA